MLSCPACGSADTLPFRPRTLPGAVEPSDLRITDARYGTTLALFRCSDCTFLFADGGDVSRLEDLYAALEDPAYDEGTEARSRQLAWLVGVCREHQPDARTLLDVGAATGLLVGIAARLGFDAVGVEPSRALSRTATERGLSVFTGTLPHPALGQRTFDIVTLVDVIEHVADPVTLCRTAAERLSEGGLMVVVTPDVRSIAARLLGPRWWHFRVAHVGYFSDPSFSRAAARAGLAIVSQRRARWFFPVGYLLARATRYLPRAGRVFQRAERNRLLAPLLRWVIPLNLLDSTVYLLRRAPSPRAK